MTVRDLSVPPPHGLHPSVRKRSKRLNCMEFLTIMPKPRLRSALNLDIDPRLLEQADAQAKHEDVGLRVIVEKALTLYLASDGLPPAIGASVAKTQADIALLAAQIEPIAAFLATIKYRDGTGARGRGIAIRGDDGEF